MDKKRKNQHIFICQRHNNMNESLSINFNSKEANMVTNSVKYGIDRCPATKNFSNASFCRNCDFRSSEQKDCCECAYHLLSKGAKTGTKALH